MGSLTSEVGAFSISLRLAFWSDVALEGPWDEPVAWGGALDWNFVFATVGSSAVWLEGRGSGPYPLSIRATCLSGSRVVSPVERRMMVGSRRIWGKNC